MIGGCGYDLCQVVTDDVHVFWLEPESRLIGEGRLGDAVVCIDPCFRAKCPLLVGVAHVGGNEPLVVELHDVNDCDVVEVELACGKFSVECTIGQCCDQTDVALGAACACHVNVHLLFAHVLYMFDGLARGCHCFRVGAGRKRWVVPEPT